MALGTYTDLLGAVASWLHRDDLATAAADFVRLAESRLRKRLRLAQQMTTATLTTTAGVSTVALPADWLQSHRLRLTSPDRALEFLPGAQFEDRYRQAESGSPAHFTIEGPSLVLGPQPDDVYSIEAVYFAAVPTLTGAAPTNWLLATYPDLYLFAALAEAAPFLGNDGRIAAWEAKYSAELQAAQAADSRARASGSSLRIRPR